MTLALTEEHLALAESVRGWAGHAAPAPVRRSAVDAEDHGAALYRDTLRPGLQSPSVAVQEALDLFNGKVVDVRETKPAKEGP